MNKKRQKFKKNIQEYLDYDYLDKLPEEARDFMDKFNEEYYAGGPKRSKEKLHPEEYKKSLYDKNNSENRDLYGLSKSVGLGATFDDSEMSDLFHQEDSRSIEYRLKLEEKSKVMDDLISEAITDIDTTFDDEIKYKILKKLIKDSIRVYNLAKKLKRKDTQISKENQ